MKSNFKRNIGLIILLVIAMVFPTSLNYQARLNMRIIVTGLAVDKSGEDFQVTAQMVKTSPGNEQPGQSAQIDFITDKGKNMAEAIAKLSYKAGKVAAFSHTNFIVLGKGLLEEDITKCLDYFIRDKIIKNSALVLFAKGDAKDEIEKTKNAELSVGIGLQKVFLYKENEGDGLMTTLIDFLNQNKTYSKSAVASELVFHTNKEAVSKEGSSSGESSGGGELSQSETGSGESSSSEESGSKQSGSSQSSSQSGESSQSGGSSQGSSTEQQYFDPEAALVCFVDGKFAGKLEDEDSIKGFMLANKKTKAVDVMLKNVNKGRLEGDKIEIVINKKNSSEKFDFQGDSPVLTVKVRAAKSHINEIMTNKVIASLTNEEFNAIKKATESEIESKIKKCFETAKQFNCDIFNAYELAYKYSHDKTKQLFDSPQEFLEKLNLKVKVDIVQLDY